MNLNDKMVEMKEVTVEVEGKKVKLGELTYGEFGELLDSLTDEEAQAVLAQIIEQIGMDSFIEFLAKVEEFSEDKDEEDEEEQSGNNTKQIVLPPVKFANMDDLFSYEPEAIIKGIDSVSNQVGQYLAFVNAGMSSEQAFELITIQDARKHEMIMADKQLELRKLEAEIQMKMAGVKQILNR